MSKELIERLRTETFPDLILLDDAAYRIMELERELEREQKRIELYEQALKASWPEGAIGDAFDYWNAARKEEI